MPRAVTQASRPDLTRADRMWLPEGPGYFRGVLRELHVTLEHFVPALLRPEDFLVRRRVVPVPDRIVVMPERHDLASRGQPNRLLVLVQADLNKIKKNPILMATTDAFGDFAKVAHTYGMTACAPLS